VGANLSPLDGPSNDGDVESRDVGDVTRAQELGDVALLSVPRFVRRLS